MEFAGSPDYRRPVFRIEALDTGARVAEVFEIRDTKTVWGGARVSSARTTKGTPGDAQA